VKGRPHYYSTKREEYAHIKFDLDAGMPSLPPTRPKLTPTRLDLPLQVEHQTNLPLHHRLLPLIPSSEAVIWDAIIPSDFARSHANTYLHPTTSKTKPSKKSKQKGKPYPEGASPGIVRLSNQKPKYQITDVSGKIAERTNATLNLHWNIQPWVGALVWTNTKTYGRWEGLKGGVSGFEFPALKGSETVKKEELRTETGGERNRGSPA